MSFSWIPIYRELAGAVLKYRDRQLELLGILRAAREQMLPVMQFSDEEPKARKSLDPFSFFAAFNRGITNEKRTAIITFIQERLGLETRAPEDFDGIPTANNMRSFFVWDADEKEMADDTNNLWNMASEAYEKKAEEASPELFEKCLEQQGISITNLTIGCFWFNPQGYLSLDGCNKGYFKKKYGLTLAASNHAEYAALLEKVRGVAEESFAEISLAAWTNRDEPPGDARVAEVANTYIRQYWAFSPGRQGEEWHRFLREGIMAINEPVGDLRLFSNKEELRKAFQSMLGTDSSVKMRTLACWEFFNTLRPGDLLFAKKGRWDVLGYGIVTGEYRYAPEHADYRHVREVEWHEKKGSITNVISDDDAQSFCVKTLTHISKNKDLIQNLSVAAGLFLDNEPDLGKRYFWLNANPAVWSFENLPVGGESFYTTTNEQGKRRKKQKCFEDARPGDVLIGYVTTPVMAVTALCEVTEGLHSRKEGEAISFVKVRELSAPVTRKELLRNPELAASEPLTNLQGTLFSLTRHEYDLIMELVDGKNPVGAQAEVSIPVEDAIPYTVDTAMDGLFMERTAFEGMVEALREKRNIILQGAPGVGKTFVAKRLAYALMGEKAAGRVEMIQFHQSYAYEDFIQGYRPDSNGTALNFELKNGVFYRFCKRAMRQPDRDFVFIIDEINRGNLSKIFGELMMLIEHDKRGGDFAIRLTYSVDGDELFYVPENLYLIGMMNTADRSLAMVDYALRRRFRFVDIGPGFETTAFRECLVGCGASPALTQKIIDRMSSVNADIAADTKNLGRGYRIGHSFFCPRNGSMPDDAWYERVIRNEIVPLLEEYWFDDPEKVDRLREKLLS